MSERSDDTWVPNWRDEHGVVHVMGLHTDTRAYTECGVMVASRALPGDWEHYYKTLHDVPATCIVCLAVTMGWE